MTIKIGGIRFDHVSYDADRDVLYLSVGEPRAAGDSESTPEGHVIRYDEDGRVLGVTIVNAKWIRDRDGKIWVTGLPEPVSGDVAAVFA